MYWWILLLITREVDLVCTYQACVTKWEPIKLWCVIHAVMRGNKVWESVQDWLVGNAIWRELWNAWSRAPGWDLSADSQQEEWYCIFKSLQRPEVCISLLCKRSCGLNLRYVHWFLRKIFSFTFQHLHTPWQRHLQLRYRCWHAVCVLPKYQWHHHYNSAHGFSKWPWVSCEVVAVQMHCSVFHLRLMHRAHRAVQSAYCLHWGGSTECRSSASQLPSSFSCGHCSLKDAFISTKAALYTKDIT